MWYLLCFVIVHVYLAIREDVMTTHSSVGTMISGWRYKRRPVTKR
jgi:Ni/Fe-hydrogenase 1 B-type cytochrome subunit